MQQEACNQIGKSCMTVAVKACAKKKDEMNFISYHHFAQAKSDMK
jgi:hypothetical protein